MAMAVAVVLASSYSSDSTPSQKFPYAMGAALKSNKPTNKKKQKQKTQKGHKETLGGIGYIYYLDNGDCIMVFAQFKLSKL